MMEESSHCSVARFTTMKVGGEARKLFHPSSCEELGALVERLKKQKEPWFVLGGGSNMLVSSGGIDGSVIRMTQMIGIRNPEQCVLEADAGARLPHLAKFAAGLGLSGLEFSVGIPGTVGGAIVMNAGAHGSCFANVVESVTLLDGETGDIKTLANKDLAFAYRTSGVDPEKHIVICARLRLTQGEAADIQKVTEHNEQYRWRTQPLGWPNLGSTFKNPAADKPAGMLLDKSGAKELKEGNAAVSAVHANFVINLGGANSDEIVRLLERMQGVVQDNFGVHLRPEWKTLGKFTPDQLKVWNGV